jgi:hypothetical protein
MSKRTLADVRAECASLGITPGRSIAECERRIAERRKPKLSKMQRVLCSRTALCGTLARNAFVYRGNMTPLMDHVLGETVRRIEARRRHGRQ